MSNLSNSIEKLTASASARDAQRTKWKMLRRGLDPRQYAAVTNDTTPQWMFDIFEKGGKPLHHNDSVTFFDLALHMLTHRDLRWHIPTKPGLEKEEKRKFGVAERAIQSIMTANDDRLVDAGQQRFQRAVADPGLETGTLCYFRRATTDDEGDTEFIINPVNPDNVFSRHDLHGLAEFVHLSKRTVDDLEAQGNNELLWNTKILADEEGGRKVLVQDYWKRTFDSNNEPVIEHGILTEKGELMPLTVVDEEEIPYKVLRLNGEMYPGELVSDGEMENFLGKSILAANEKIYLEKEDFLADLRKHMQEVLTAGLFYTARGRQPIMDPQKVLGTKERTLDVFDVGEGNPGTFPVNPFDQALQFVWLDLEAGRQRGSVPDLLHGNLQVQLSGFAISQVLEASLVQIGEASKVLEHLFSDLGTWILRRLKDENAEVNVVGFTAGTGRREYWDEDFAAADLPEKFRVFAEISLARPSDLTERIAQARSLDPSGGKLVTHTTIFETILWDLVQDPQQEQEDIFEELLQQLPEMLKIQFIESLRHRQKKEERNGTRESRDTAAIIEQVIEQIKQTLPTGPGNPAQANQPGGEASGNPPPSALPVEGRAAGAGAGGPAGTTANQQSQV